MTRLELVATLRELGLSQAEVRSVLNRENTMAEVAAIHVVALDAHITTLQLRHAVLSAIAAGDREEPGHMDLLNRMARLSAQEREQIIDDFAARICDGLDAEPQLRDRLRGGGRQLPDAPTQEQLDASLELSEMVQDPEFQQVARRAMEQSSSGQTMTSGAGHYSEPDRNRLFAQNLDRTVGAAMREGIAPNSPRAAEIVDRLLGNPGPERRTAVRDRLRAHLDTGIDERLEHYRQLLALIHGQQPPSPRAALYAWLADANDAGAGPQLVEQR
ncbi:MerR family transcriptional regulator [Streptomyces monashensis]|uniref:MerR family transcriptional regulator n=1 Tax=Streptomyces monashensis TaxID=1678012 RepID=UPI003410753F